MTVGGSAGIDGPVELQVLADTARCQAYQLAQRARQFVFIDTTGAKRVDVQRDGFCHADGVGELNLAPIRQTGCDDVFRQVAGNVGGRAIDLARVLAGKCAAAVRRRTTVSIDNDLAAGQSGVAVGSTDNEAAGGIDDQPVAGSDQPSGNALLT